MPSTASETVAFSSRPAPIVRSKPASQGRHGTETPFAQMLEASAPPASDAARPAEPSELATPAQKTAAIPDQKKSTADRTGDSQTAGRAGRPDETCCNTHKAKESSAATDIPAEELPALPPEMAPPSEQTTPADEETAIAVLPVGQALPQPLPSEQPVAAAAPSPIVAETPTETPSDAIDAAPELAAKPAVSPAAPLPATAEAEAETDTAGALPTPDIAAVKHPKQAALAPARSDAKAADETKTAAPDVAGETADTGAAAEDGNVAKAHRGQSVEDHARQTHGHDDARPQARSGGADLPQHKPALPSTASPAAEPTHTPPPMSTVAVPDAARVAIDHPRTPLVAATAVPVSGIAVEIAAQARAGNNRFEIRLDPPELGRIDVRLDVDREGNVKSRLVIERTDTYDLLRRDASTLERALQQAGLKTSDNGLEFTLRDQGASQREAREQSQRNAERAIVADADIPPAEAAQGYGRLLGLGTGLDIRI